MQSEICPTLGPICRTTFADLHISPKKFVSPIEIYMTETVSVNTPQKILPVADFIELLKKAARSLKSLNTHTGDATLIGLPSAQVEDLEVVMARVERKQKDWIDKDLVVEAESEAFETRAAMARLLPIVTKARNGELSAEELLAALNSEPNPRVARERFLAQRGEAITLRDENEILASASFSALPKSYRSAKSRQLKGRVTIVDTPASSICFLLVDDFPADDLFHPTDTGYRTILLQSNDADSLSLLGLCAACSIEVVLELATSVNISGAGLAYSGTIVRVMDQDVVSAAIKEALQNRFSGLF